ncbi:protein translocase subunit SecD [bacterium]|nr:protein translocase subunit SecD [bacterium]
MSNKPFIWRFFFVLIITVFSLIFIYQTVKWYKIPETTKREMYSNKEYAQKYRRIIKLGLDLQGGIHLVLQADTTNLKPNEKKDIVDRIITVIRSRIDQTGVLEPLIRKEGPNKIVVELPGMKDPQRAINLVTQTAFLEFKLLDEKNQPRVNLFLDENNEPKSDILPPNDELLFEISVNKSTGEKERTPYLIKKFSLLNGNELKSAQVIFDPTSGTPNVQLKFKPEGGRKFSRITEQNIGKRLAIILNGQVMSAPVIRTKIPANSGAIIEGGGMTLQDAKDLALVLRAGALPAPVEIVENQTVGPTLGQDSIEKGKWALLIGLIFIIIFMIVIYGGWGIIIDLTLVVELIAILGIMSLFNFTLTFPGIAGLVLTIGMAVDANILIYERMREELARGNSIVASIRRGFSKAFLTIMDANITTLIAAAVLFQFGTGPIKGFAVTLSVGIIASLFGALVFSRMCFEYLIGTVHIKKFNL